MDGISKATLRRIKRCDRAARWIITLGGVTIIASVIAILVLIVSVALPLFRPARVEPLGEAALPASIPLKEVLSVGGDIALDGQGAMACVFTRDGTVVFVDLTNQKVLKTQAVKLPEGSKAKSLQSVERHGGSRYSLLWSDGAVSLVEVVSASERDAQGNRRAKCEALTRAAELSGGPLPTIALLRSPREGSVTCARLLADGRLSVSRQVTTENLLGDKETKSEKVAVETAGLAPITALTMDRDGTTLYAGTEKGQLARWQFDEEGQVKSREVVQAFADRRAITALAMVLGDVSLAVGDAAGGLTTWFPVRIDGKGRLTRVHTLGSHPGAVRQLLASTRNKSLVSLDDAGAVGVDYTTSERRLALLEREPPLVQAGSSPRGDAVIGLDAAGNLLAWQIDSPHPEVSWKTLFGKVHYEGYDEPSYTWQTTGSADSEPKLSLVPLVFGTLKGTFYAMLFAVPLALFGAIYVAHFTTPGFKRTIKPVVEIMAAIPSVVIGFLIALWLAPRIERWLLAVFLSLVTVPLVFVTFMSFWQAVRRYDWAKRIEAGYEFLALVPVLLAGVGLASLLMTPVESLVFGGDFKLWLSQVMGLGYDQRNSIIIAFGLGFAVIPIIFSIAEDSLSSVPYNFTAASMALGASRWQTLWRVVLPSASPGIFAGIMIGFGRAVGETMIVLMATGNTPILDWSPLNGMRTLSANIAVEAPEAPAGGTLYRVLFLCAVLLFLLTFALNTAAELVRQRLRSRYGRY